MIIICLRKLISGDKIFLAKLMDSYKGGFPAEITEMQGSIWLVFYTLCHLHSQNSASCRDSVSQECVDEVI